MNQAGPQFPDFEFEDETNLAAIRPITVELFYCEFREKCDATKSMDTDDDHGSSRCLGSTGIWAR